MNDNMPVGFMYNGRRIFYIDPQGKDVSFERWRLDGYYAPQYAKTIFFSTEEEYLDFQREKAPHCYADFEMFRRSDRNNKRGVI